MGWAPRWGGGSGKPGVPPEVGKSTSPRPHNPTTSDLIVEVAHVTLDLDYSIKAELYATAGVPDYWVIDVENRLLLVFREPFAFPAGRGANSYRTRQTYGPNDAVSPLAMPTATVRVTDLLPKVTSS